MAPPENVRGPVPLFFAARLLKKLSIDDFGPLSKKSSAYKATTCTRPSLGRFMWVYYPLDGRFERPCYSLLRSSVMAVADAARISGLNSGSRPPQPCLRCRYAQFSGVTRFFSQRQHAAVCRLPPSRQPKGIWMPRLSTLLHHEGVGRQNRRKSTVWSDNGEGWTSASPSPALKMSCFWA